MKAVDVRSQRAAVAGVLLIAVLSAGCGSSRAPNSPDVLYSANAESARALQVPPDLTDVSDSEQFVLPGRVEGVVTRNTLLPTFESARFVREGEQAWLAFQEAPEALWPRLLEFLRADDFTVEQTEPVAGTIFTTWRPAAAEGAGGLLKNLVGVEQEFERVGFRLERDGEAGSRLFARRQLGPEPDAGTATDRQWPQSAHNPESTAALLQRLLVFLGVESQQAEGLLDVSARDAILSDAVLQTSSVGSQMLHNRGYQPTVREVTRALGTLGFEVLDTDVGTGRIEVARGDAAAGGSVSRLVVKIEPVHVSAALVSLTDSDGQRLAGADERSLLGALRDLLA